MALGWVVALPLSVAVAEGAMWTAAFLWAVEWLRRELGRFGEPEPTLTPGPAGDTFSLLGTPILGFLGISLLSATLSRDPIESLWELREIFLFAAPLVTYAAFREPGLRRRAVRLFTVAVAVAVAWGLLQTVRASQTGAFPGAYRPDGAFGHYMTYAGMLMVAVPLLLAVRDGWAALAGRGVAVGALLVIGLTMTRSAWIGCVAGLLVYGACGWVPGHRKAPPRPRRWGATGVAVVVVGVVAVLVLLALAGPQALRERGASIFSLENPTNRDRLAMAATGLRIIAHYPLLGIGPGLMGRVYPAWRVEWAVKENNAHLHNNALQIAAERGLLGLALWLWMVAAFVVGAWRVLRATGPAGDGGPAARAALAALAAFLTMGLFEYNFSDSEVLMTLLFATTLPLAASAPRRS